MCSIRRTIFKIVVFVAVSGLETIYAEGLKCLEVWRLYSYDIVVSSKRVWRHRLRHTTYTSASQLMVCSRNPVVTGYTEPVPKFLTWFKIRVITTRFSTAIVQNTTNFDLYLHLFTMFNSIVALTYFPHHTHKLHHSITRGALVSKITNIITCDAPKLWFLSASLYVSKRGAYWDRLCRDIVGWLVVTRVHCGQMVHPRPIVTTEH